MEYYNKLEDPTDEENDMLDLAFGLTETWVLSASKH
jgi:ferredoxin